MRKRAEKCVCGHGRSWHWLHLMDGIRDVGCMVNRCLNNCQAWRPVNLPDHGERPMFGVHRVPPSEAWDERIIDDD